MLLSLSFDRKINKCLTVLQFLFLALAYFQPWLSWGKKWEVISSDF